LLRNNSENSLNNPNLCLENIIRFKRMIDKFTYDGPIAAMSDNTKLKSGLRYCSELGCIVGSILNSDECKISTFEDISSTVHIIKNKDAMAKDVRAYILQV